MAESVSDETRERITVEAARAVRAAPVSALSVQQVAEAAGVTSSSIYKAYSSKYELFAEASRRVLVEQVVAIAEGVDEAAPPLERLRQVLTGLFHVGRDEPFPAAYLYGMFPLLHHKEVDDAVQEKIDHVDAEVRRRLRHRIVDALDAGALAGDPDELVELCAVATFGYLGMAVNHDEPVAPETFADFVLAGLAAGPAG